jgi:membrane protease YdiL (CAAX protease family)
MAWVILWTLLFLGVSFGTFISAIVAIVVKGKWQRTCVDVLLVFTTLVVVIGLSAEFLPKDIIEKETTKLPQSARLKQADLSASGLIGVSYLEQFEGPLKLIVGIEEKNLPQKSTEKVLESVKTLAKYYPNDDELTARLIILTKNSGEDTKPVFEHYTRSGGKMSPLLTSLQHLYLDPKSFEPATDIAAIKALPSGWYRQSTTEEAYKLTNSPLLATEIAEAEKKSSEWRAKYAVFHVLKLLLAALGAYVIFDALMKKRDSGAFEPLSKDFRRVYAIILSTLYAQTAISILVGVCIGMATVLTHTEPNAAEQKKLIELASIVSGVSLAILTFYFLVCRPNKLSIRQAFMRGNQVTSPLQFAQLVGAGFAAMVSLNMAIRFLRSLLPEAPVAVSNSAQLTMINSFVSLDYLSIFGSIFFILILAPFCEELLFRGLLYGWLRNRFGVKVGIICSALIFAGYHFDLAGFWQYFGIGIILAAFYERSRSLLVTTAIHGMWNGWIVLATAVLVNR